MLDGREMSSWCEEGEEEVRENANEREEMRGKD